jgi:hypothetical protein
MWCQNSILEAKKFIKIQIRQIIVGLQLFKIKSTTVEIILWENRTCDSCTFEPTVVWINQIKIRNDGIVKEMGS